MHPVGPDVDHGRGAGRSSTCPARTRSAPRTCSRSGLLSWLYPRPTEGTEAFLKNKFGARPDILEANLAALHAGCNYGETTEDFAVSYEIAPAPMPAGTYRNITGNLALAYGLVAASHRAGLPLFLGSYPITPASDILHDARRAQALRRDARSRPRTRSPASARPSAPRSAARSASPPPPAPASR